MPSLVPGLAHSSLAVQNLPGLIHHVMCAAGRVFTSANNGCWVAEYMYKEVKS